MPPTNAPTMASVAPACGVWQPTQPHPLLWNLLSTPTPGGQVFSPGARGTLKISHRNSGKWVFPLANWSFPLTTTYS